MEWILRHGGDVFAHVETSDDFIDWLGALARPAPMAAIDPYRDVTLDCEAAARWLRALCAIRDAAIASARAHHEAHSHLPRAAGAREEVLARLVEQTLARMPHQATLADLIALFEIAIDSGAPVTLVGD